MKTISELQQEIRLIRKDINKMDERLSVIDDELMTFKDSIQEDTNFGHIYNLAEVMPIIHHPITSLEPKQKSVYLGTLLMIATLEDSISDQQLLFLQRMVMWEADRNRIDYYMVNLGKIQPDNVIYHLADEKMKTQAKYLLLDMIIIAKLSKNCSMKSYELISDIALVLKFTKSSFSEICSVAVSILKQNYDDIPREKIVYLNEKYGYYLNELNGWAILVENVAKDYKRIQDELRSAIFMDELYD